jgi:hypothetical protein
MMDAEEERSVMSTVSTPVEVFCSYANADEAWLRKRIASREILPGGKMWEGSCEEKETV